MLHVTVYGPYGRNMFEPLHNIQSVSRRADVFTEHKQQNKRPDNIASVGANSDSTVISQLNWQFMPMYLPCNRVP